MYKDKFSEKTSLLSRFDDDEEEVTFPAIMPRRFAKKIFGDH